MGNLLILDKLINLTCSKGILIPTYLCPVRNALSNAGLIITYEFLVKSLLIDAYYRVEKLPNLSRITLTNLL